MAVLTKGCNITHLVGNDNVFEVCQFGMLGTFKKVENHKTRQPVFGFRYNSDFNQVFNYYSAFGFSNSRFVASLGLRLLSDLNHHMHFRDKCDPTEDIIQILQQLRLNVRAPRVLMCDGIGQSFCFWVSDYVNLTSFFLPPPQPTRLG